MCQAVPNIEVEAHTLSAVKDILSISTDTYI